MQRREFLSLPLVGWLAGKCGVKPPKPDGPQYGADVGIKSLSETIREFLEDGEQVVWQATDASGTIRKIVVDYYESEWQPGVYYAAIPSDKMGAAKTMQFVEMRPIT